MKNVKNLISVMYTFLKFSVIKIVRWKTFKFKLIERFSPNTTINIWKDGQLSFGKMVRAHTGSNFSVVTNGDLNVGDFTSFGYGCILVCRQKITIGEGCEFGPNVLIYDHDHDFKVEGGLKAKKFKTGDIEIGKNVWIGANTVILRNTKIGDNSVIGAGSIINGEYPANSLVVQKRITSVVELRGETK